MSDHKLLAPRTTTSRRHGSSDYDSDSEYGQPRKIFRNQHYKTTSNSNSGGSSNNRGSANRRSSGGGSSSNYHHRHPHQNNNSYSKSNNTHKSYDSKNSTTTPTTSKKSSSSGGGGGSDKYDPFADIEIDLLPKELPKKKNDSKQDNGKYDATKDLLKEVDDDFILQLVMGQQDISAESLLQSIGHSEPLQKTLSSSSSSTTLKNFKSDKKSVKCYSPSSSTSSSSASSSRASTPTSSSLPVINNITTTSIVSGKKGTTNLLLLKSPSLSSSDNLKEPQKITNLLSFLESDNFMDKFNFEDELTTHLVKCQKVQKVTNTTTDDHNSNIFNSQNSKLNIHQYNKSSSNKHNEHSPEPIKKNINKEKIDINDKKSSSSSSSSRSSSNNNITSPTSQKHRVVSPSASHINSVFKDQKVLFNKSRTPPTTPPPSHSNSNSRSTTPSKSPSSSRRSSSTSRSTSRSKSPPGSQIIVTPTTTTNASPKILLDSNNRSGSKTPPPPTMKMSSSSSSSSSKHRSRTPSDSRSKSPLISPRSKSSTTTIATTTSDKKENDNKRSRSKSRSRTPSRSRRRSNSDRKRTKYQPSRSRSRSKSPPSSSSSSRQHNNIKSRKHHHSRSRSRSISPHRQPRHHNVRYNNNNNNNYNHHTNNNRRTHHNGRYPGNNRDRGRERSVERIPRQSVRDSPIKDHDRSDRISSRHDRNDNRHRSQDDYRRGDEIDYRDRDRAPGYSRHSYKSHENNNSMRRRDSSEERALRIQEAMEGYDGPPRHPHIYRDGKPSYVNGRGIDHFLPPLPNSNSKNLDSTLLSHESTSPQQLQLNVADSTISDSELAENCGQFLSSQNSIELNGVMCQQDPSGFPSSSSPKRLSLDERLEMEMGIKLREEPSSYRSVQPFHHMAGAYGRKHGTSNNNNNNNSNGRFPPLPGHIAHPQASQPRLISQAIQNGDEFQIIPGEIPEKPFTVSKHNAKLNPNQVQNANYVIPEQGDENIIKKVTIKLPVVPFKFYLPKLDLEQYLQQQQQYHAERAHSTKHSQRIRRKLHKKKKEKVVVVETQQEISETVKVDVSNEKEVTDVSDEKVSSEAKSSKVETDETVARPDDMAEADEQEEEETTSVPDSPIYVNKVPSLPDALPPKGILLVAGFSERIFNDKEKSSKGVKFLDGIAPGYGTSRSEGEDMGCSPPPASQNDLLIKKKKNKEKRKKLKSARRLERERLKNESKVSTDDVEDKMSALQVSSPPPPPSFSYPYCPVHVLYQFNPSYAVLYAQSMAESGFEVTFEPTYEVDDERPLEEERDHVHIKTSSTNEIILTSDPNLMDTLDDSNLLKFNL